VNASFRGKNDLAVDGRKIAGLGLYLNGTGGMLFHASVLADLDIPLMLEVLDIPAAKLGDRAAAAVSERVTTVSRETGGRWDGADLREVMAQAIRAELGVELVAGGLEADEADLARRLVATRYGTVAWQEEYSPRADATATATVRLAAGTARVYLACADRTIKSLLFTGDFNSVPAPLVEVEEQLRWKRLEPDLVGAVVRRCLDGHREVADPGAVADAILAAAARAAEPPSAAPERAGSCYFPEVEQVR
jgi:lipoate-protein ligase A